MHRFVLASTVFALAGLASANNPPGTNPATVEKILQVGKTKNRVMDLLNELTHKIGPRLTGSANALKACQWAEKKFKEFGLQNVHLEEWGEMPVSFNRGKRMSAKMLEPYETDLVFTTDAWTPGTPGPMKGKAVNAPKNEEEFEKVKDQLKGAWLMVEGGGRGARGGASALDQKINEAGILGRVSSSGRETVTTGGRFTGLEWDKLPTERRIRIRKSDFDKVQGYLALNQTVTLEFDIENIFVKGPTKLYNVIADIPGTEKPDEMVIVCGHLDSWDGPGSLGANDNGTGTVAAMEAARLLMLSGAKPKRTIRFILWTGEEQGLLGSRAYVQKHKEDWPKISAVLNDDGGTNYHGGHVVLESQVSMFQPIIDLMNTAFPELPQKLQVVQRMPRGGSSDHASFNQVGVPGFYTIEAGRADYGFVWHTQNDRPEHSIPEYMIQSSTDHAMMSYAIACAPTLLPREAPGTGGGGGSLAEFVKEGGRIPYGPLHDEHDGHDHDHDDDYWAYVLDVVKRTVGRAIRAAR
jgi:carboxypeptidase Q